MNHFYTVSNIGEVYVPSEGREAVFARPRVKHFARKELKYLGRISTHLSKGGVAVVEGPWEQIKLVTDYVGRHQNERLYRKRPRDEKAGNRNSARRAVSPNDMRLMCWADAAGVLKVQPPPEIPYLLELIGEPPGANEGHPFLVTIASVERILNALKTTYPIHALGVSLVASANVLAPRSQETVDCFQQALQHIFANRLKDKFLEVVDIGCGSGLLTLLAHQELGKNAMIYASDLLPEAIATTKLNVEKHLPNSENIQILPAGELFEPFGERRFDIVVFNPPWSIMRARNRAELAIHDEKQQTVTRFFQQVPRFLKPDGVILLGYADTSGPKAIANLDDIIASTELTVDNVFKRRVATHRAKRKWEQIRVYVLGR